MKPISNLGGKRSRLSCRLSIGSSTITADGFDSWMSASAKLQRWSFLCQVIGQPDAAVRGRLKWCHISALCAGQNRLFQAPQGSLVQASQGLERVAEAYLNSRAPHDFCQACAGIASQHETNALQLRVAALGPSGIGFDLFAQSFGKRAPRTHDIGTNKTTHT